VLLIGKLYEWFDLFLNGPLTWWFQWGWFLMRCDGHCPVVLDASIDCADSGWCSIECGGAIIAGSSGSIQMPIKICSAVAITAFGKSEDVAMEKQGCMFQN